MTSTPPEGEKPRVIPAIPLWAKVLLIWLGTLITLVIAVGLARKQLDATGVALSLISLLGGVVGGVMLKIIGKNGGER